MTQYASFASVQVLTPAEILHFNLAGRAGLWPMPSYKNLRIAESSGIRMVPHASDLEWTPNHFAERCVDAICEMIEDPAKLTVPDFVVMLHAKHENRRKPKALGDSYARIRAVPPPEESLHVAEAPPPRKKR